MHCAACPEPAEPGAPVPLCARHLELARDWAEREREDALPGPCPVCGSRLGVRYPSGWLCAVCEWRFGDQPDAELPPPRVDVVYYIRFDQRIKIGTTANPRQRLGRLWHEELLAFERGDRHTERRRHAQFAKHRLGHSEWFDRHEELDAHIRSLAHPDPWSLHARWCSEALALRG